ncbi:MAG: hypothetical protein L7S63_04040 [Flavobacteriales bacterium]|nr:hypothetical protein [Flavobacteriales bacterium]
MKRNAFPFVILVLVGIGVYSLLQPEVGNLDADLSTHFAIEDTAAVVRIRIADTDGRAATVERIPGHPLGLWRLNDRYMARKDATDLLLKTFKRVSVRQPVRATAKAGVLKMMAASGKRVDIYVDGQEDPVKTWYIGTPTQSHTGTHMLLELPGTGRAEQPYITHIEGFTGFLSTRFFTDENEWRYTGVFESSADHIASISGTPLNDVGAPATLTWGGEGGLLSAAEDGRGLTLPQRMLQDQWLKFTKVHVETWNSHLSESAQDSLRLSPAAWRLNVTYKDGHSASIDLHWKAPIMEEYDESGKLLNHDGSRMYAVVNGECALVQTFVFNPILEFWRTLPEMTSQSTSS